MRRNLPPHAVYIGGGLYVHPLWAKWLGLTPKTKTKHHHRRKARNVPRTASHHQ